MTTYIVKISCEQAGFEEEVYRVDLNEDTLDFSGVINKLLSSIQSAVDSVTSSSIWARLMNILSLIQPTP
jgi:hypothetical protein